MLWFKKRVPVMNGKRFVAAYSEKAFVEAKNSARYSDYTFHELGGMNWCVRVGDIDVPFGFGGEGNNILLVLGSGEGTS